MNVHEFTALNERLKAKQAELFDHLTQDPSAAVTSALERLLHILDWVRLEHYVDDGCGQGRPPRDHFAIANAFMAKAVLGISTTVGLIDRLQVDKTLRRLCGFSRFKKLPNESTFSRVFAQLAERRLLERVHAELITSQLGEQLIGHMSRDGTAICAREKPQKKVQATVPAASSPAPRKRGRPRAAKSLKPSLPRRSPCKCNKQQRCRWRNCPLRAIAAPNAMRRAIKTVGMATGCTWTRQTVMCLSVWRLPTHRF